jgi:DNA-binding transcriptional ArsR family regulator
MAKEPESRACCSPRPTLKERPLMSAEHAAALGDLFRVFANDTRLRLLHALARSGGLGVGELADAVAMKPQAVSNQLQRLADRGILGSRRHGTSIRYRIVDPCVTSLLDLGLCLREDADSRRGASRVMSPAAGSPSPGVSGRTEGT